MMSQFLSGVTMVIIPHMVREQPIIPAFVFLLMDYTLFLTLDKWFYFQDSFEFTSCSAVCF